MAGPGTKTLGMAMAVCYVISYYGYDINQYLPYLRIAYSTVIAIELLMFAFVYQRIDHSKNRNQIIEAPGQYLSLSSVDDKGKIKTKDYDKRELAKLFTQFIIRAVFMVFLQFFMENIAGSTLLVQLLLTPSFWLNPLFKIFILHQDIKRPFPITNPLINSYESMKNNLKKSDEKEKEKIENKDIIKEDEKVQDVTDEGKEDETVKDVTDEEDETVKDVTDEDDETDEDEDNDSKKKINRSVLLNFVHFKFKLKR